jgi:hypothetical protein
MYACGLRISEAATLEITAIDGPNAWSGSSARATRSAACRCRSQSSPSCGACGRLIAIGAGYARAEMAKGRSPMGSTRAGGQNLTGARHWPRAGPSATEENCFVEALMTDRPITLDRHRGMAAQKATDIRRLMAEVEANEKSLRDKELEAQLVAAAAATWPEAAEKARYLLGLFASTATAQDARRKMLIANRTSSASLRPRAENKPNRGRHPLPRTCKGNLTWQRNSREAIARRENQRPTSRSQRRKSHPLGACRASAARAVQARRVAEASRGNTARCALQTKIERSTQTPPVRKRARNDMERERHPHEDETNVQSS